MTHTRHNWTLAELRRIYNLAFSDLLYQAQTVHRQHFNPTQVQLCTLLSIKTGGCPEDCAYCPQSAHYETDVQKHKLMSVADVANAAQNAKNNGSTRFCMGAAWRHVKDGPEFDQVLEMVRTVAALDVEVCCTLGMLSADQAQRLKEAGLTAYNHNLDTGPDYYDRIISTRRYEDRLTTLQNVRHAGISVCCGGILGMGETIDDRLAMLHVLATATPHPESVPINALVAVKGTPLQDRPPLDGIDIVRMIATTRIVLPQSRVRLSAGRTQMSDELQALCFLAGANSIFTGEKLLTTANPGDHADQQLLSKLGLAKEPSVHAGCVG